MKHKMLLVTLLFSSVVQAAATFTPEEVSAHQSKLPIIVSVSAQCLRDTYKDHLDFYAKWGVSKYYGDRKPEYSTRAGRLEALKQAGAPAELIDSLTPTSCVGLTMACMSKGFAAAGHSSMWKKIYNDLAINRAFDGMQLQASLQNLGWKILYWNPDTSSNEKWDAEDRKLNPLKPGKTWNPVWGGHAERYTQVQRNGRYYKIKVDDAKTLVDFRDLQPASFREVPFFVGTAHAGYHVFPGFNGNIIEAHSMRNLKSKDNLEKSEFNPIGKGGGPRWTKSEKYRSGVIAIPPTF